MKLVIHEDVGKGSNSEEKAYTKEAILSGDSSILNLDKDHSKLFIGGLPATFHAQDNIVEQSLEGRVEDLKLGNTFVGLWNFVDLAGANNGSIERYYKFVLKCYKFDIYIKCKLLKILYFILRNKFTNTPSTSGYRMNGEGFVVLESRFYQMKSKSSILLSIKTTSTDGLIFLAFKDKTFMSVELESGSVVYRVSTFHIIYYVYI